MMTVGLLGDTAPEISRMPMRSHADSQSSITIGKMEYRRRSNISRVPCRVLNTSGSKKIQCPSLCLTSVVFPVPGFPWTHVSLPGANIASHGLDGFSDFMLRNRSMSSDSGDDESLTRQILSLLWENNAFVPYIGAWLLYSMLVLILLVYIAIKV